MEIKVTLSQIFELKADKGKSMYKMQEDPFSILSDIY